MWMPSLLRSHLILFIKGPHGDGHGGQMVSGGAAGTEVGWAGGEAGIADNIKK